MNIYKLKEIYLFWRNEMNIAILNIKDILKILIRLIIVIVSLITFLNLITNKIYISESIFKLSLQECLAEEISRATIKDKKDKLLANIDKEKILAVYAKNIVLTDEIKENKTKESQEEQVEEVITVENILPNIGITGVTTTPISERNIQEISTNIYGTVKIKNQSKYELTEETLRPDVEIENLRNVLIYHTHTCESYTPSEEYNYTMTGNYRTTDANYNMIRVGLELANRLTENGFTVEHCTTMHDYPSYSGSYDRSEDTVKNLLYGKNTELVIDLHRDAVGDGTTYGPTVEINGENVAQLMFVIGTDGGGLEHPNWIQNLKIAVKIQEKANEMYPGLFRPIVLRNSRYNQHLAKGACIIEVGATANTLKESLLSMQCLANVLSNI